MLSCTRLRYRVVVIGDICRQTLHVNDARREERNFHCEEEDFYVMSFAREARVKGGVRQKMWKYFIAERHRHLHSGTLTLVFAKSFM